jgi:hypothetical protein
MIRLPTRWFGEPAGLDYTWVHKADALLHCPNRLHLAQSGDKSQGDFR